jgi:hypothetical protein
VESLAGIPWNLWPDSVEYAGVVDDIDGMSGGPIFTLKNVGNEWRYFVIGIQSGWYPDSRVIAACPFASLGAALEEIVMEVHLKLDEQKNQPVRGHHPT